MEALPLYEFPPKPVLVRQWKSDYLSVLFGDDSDRFIVPDDGPINRLLKLSRLRWYTTRNTTGCPNHEYLIAELSLGPTTLGYVRLESLCCDSIALGMNSDARDSEMEPPAPPNTLSNSITSLSESSPLPGSDLDASLMEPVSVPPSHNDPTCAVDHPPLLKLTSTSSAYASVVCHPQGFDTPDELLLDFDSSSPDTMPNVRPLTLLDLAFLADVVDTLCISINGERPTCNCFAEGMVGVVDLLQASETAHNSSPLSIFGRGANEDPSDSNDHRTLNTLQLRDRFYESRDPLFLDNALRRIDRTTNDYDRAIEILRTANKGLNEALQRLERATTEARDSSARANIAAREAFEARERADIAQRELEALLNARNERHAMVAETVAMAYEEYPPSD